METNNYETVKCYHCNAEAISREHVPPLCLFPEAKDVLGMNFRKDLITVPSCDLHNSRKSHDDEFLMVSVASIVSNNRLGYVHTKTKIERALRRKSQDFINKAVVRNMRGKVLVASDGKKFPVLIGNPDITRLTKCFEDIAYGVWYHEHGSRFKGLIKMVFGFLIHERKDDQTLMKFIKRRFEVDPGLLTVKGSNPEVFTYQFCKPDNAGSISLKLTFYQGTDVFIAMLPEGLPVPYNLGVDLINKGIRSTMTLGDEEFEFNNPDQ